MLGLKQFQRSVILGFLALAFICATFSSARAGDDPDSPKARLSQGTVSPSQKTLNFEPVRLMDGSELTLITPEKWSLTATKLLGIIQQTHREFTNLFGEMPKITTSVRLIDEDTFFLATGAPKWTNAMFYKGQIIIPMAAHTTDDTDNLYRSVKHEYTHAIIHALSGGKAPGWLDEGLAQWSEGNQNPALYKALKNWLDNNSPVPMSMLQGGFTRLNISMVPAAYAESLVAAKIVINTYGFKALRDYFDHLRNGIDKGSAFVAAFSSTEDDFEDRLACVLNVPHCLAAGGAKSCKPCEHFPENF